MLHTMLFFVTWDQFYKENKDKILDGSASLRLASHKWEKHCGHSRELSDYLILAVHHTIDVQLKDSGSINEMLKL